MNKPNNFTEQDVFVYTHHFASIDVNFVARVDGPQCINRGVVALDGKWSREMSAQDKAKIFWEYRDFKQKMMQDLADRAEKWAILDALIWPTDKLVEISVYFKGRPPVRCQERVPLNMAAKFAAELMAQAIKP